MRCDMSSYVSLFINCYSGYLTDGCCSMQAEALVLFSQFSSFPEPEPDMVVWFPWTWTWYGGCLLQVCDSQFLHIQLLCKFTCMNWQYPAVIICFSGLVQNLSKTEGRDSSIQRRGMIWYLLLLGMGTFTHVVFSHFWNVNHIQKKVGSNRLL